MLRVMQHIGPMITVEMRSYIAEQDAINQYERMKKDPVLSKKKLLLRAADKSETLVEVANIKRMDVIKFSDVSQYLRAKGKE